MVSAPTIAILVSSLFANSSLLFMLLRNRSKETSHIFFLVFLGALIIWNVSIIVFQLTAAVFPAQLAFATIIFAPVGFLGFSLTYPKVVSFWKPLTAGLSLFAIFLMFLSFTPYIVKDIVTAPHLHVDYGPLYALYGLFFSVATFLGILLFALRLKTVEKKYRNELLILLFGVIFSALGAMVPNLFLPLIGNTKFVALGPVALLIFAFSATYVLINKGLFNVRIILSEGLIAGTILVLLFHLLLSDNLLDLFIRSGTLIVFSIVGLLLVKSVIKEHDVAEKIHYLNDNLLKKNSKLESLTGKLQEANKHLQELMNIKTEFLQIASHQLRTPLTSLRGFLKMQAEGDLDNLPEEERKKLHGDMATVADNLNNIVNDLLKATELEGGNLNFDITKIQVQDVIEEAVSTLKPIYNNKGLSITFKRDDSLPEIEADEGFLRQVFLNILNNAEKYTEKGGVTISVSSEGENIKILISDTGVGISREDLDKLFGKFVRGKKAALIHTDGSGLGLYIIKKIVDAHHGRVTLDSEGVGKGTTISITLPKKQPSL